MAKFKRDYIRIENLSQFLIKEVKRFHPDDPRYIKYWREIKKKVYEGLWGFEFGGYRYCPGRLYFYGNFGTILDVDEEQNVRDSIKPLVRDIEWERSYTGTHATVYLFKSFLSRANFQKSLEKRSKTCTEKSA